MRLQNKRVNDSMEVYHNSHGRYQQAEEDLGETSVVKKWLQVKYRKSAVYKKNIATDCRRTFKKKKILK